MKASRRDSSLGRMVRGIELGSEFFTMRDPVKARLTAAQETQTVDRIHGEECTFAVKVSIV